MRAWAECGTKDCFEWTKGLYCPEHLEAWKARAEASAKRMKKLWEQARAEGRKGLDKRGTIES